MGGFMSQGIVTEQRVIDELKNAIVETLGADEDDIKPESFLVSDLNAESLDFLDINYRLEQTFGFKMARHFVLEHIEEVFGEGTAIDDDGQLTEKAVEVLKLRFSDELPDLKPGMDMDEVPSLITVQSIANAVVDILDSLPENCPKCNASSWKSDDGTHILCGSCNEDAPFKNGDELTLEWLTRIQEEKKIF
jgi:acyl carrier protein